MQWIRENLFLACLVGVLVVCFGAAFAVRSGQDAAFETEDMDPRSDTAFEIGQLGNSKPVNKEWLASAKGRLTRATKRGPQAVIDEVNRTFAEWDDGHYAWPDDWPRWQRAQDDAVTDMRHVDRRMR